MNKIVMLFSAITLLLAGCSNEAKEPVADAELNKEKVTEEVSNADTEEKDEVKEDEVEAGVQGGLSEIGQVIKEAQYSVELLKIKDIDETLERGPLSLHLIDAKLIRMFDLSKAMKSELQQYTSNSITNEIAYIQLQYETKNNSDEDITWNRIHDIVTDQDEQVSGNDDFLSQEFIYDIYAGAEIDYLNGYMVDPNANHLRLIFSPVYKYDTFDELAEQFEYEFSFDD